MTTTRATATWSARTSGRRRKASRTAAERILSTCEASVSRPVAHRERIVPDETEPGIVALHLKRYDFARPYCEGKVVLDAGCGVGYGTAHLAACARHAVGIDADADAVAYARRRYAAPNVEFAVGDLATLEHPKASFDAVKMRLTQSIRGEPARQ